jgi:hypothetical protein
MSFVVYRTRRAEMRRAQEMSCHVVRESDFRLVGGRAIDLSPDGMLVRVKEPVPIGESLIISFRAHEIGIWFDTDATVTRCVLGRRANDPLLAEPCDDVRRGISPRRLASGERHEADVVVHNGEPPRVPGKPPRLRSGENEAAQ